MVAIAIEAKLHRQNRMLAKEAYKKQGVVAIMSVINVSLAIVVNELCSRSALSFAICRARRTR